MNYYSQSLCTAYQHTYVTLAMPEFPIARKFIEQRIDVLFR